MVLPMRIIVIVSICVFAWLLAVGGLLGLSEEDIETKPFTGWRRQLRLILARIMCAACLAGGMSIVVKGKQATREEAPILVIAPHSSFLDAVILYVTGFPTIICRKESGTNPWLGKILAYSQPIMVSREDHDSRQKTIQHIIDRVHSKEFTSQILIFPEGTCTNRSCLITFKPGAFYPGVPIQPVLMRYPNKLDTVTWTWEGPGIYKLLWLTLVQPQFVCEIEFLPVYKPSEAEKKDPKLYADNVRQHMAKILGIPTMDYTYNDCKLVSKAKRLSYSKSSPLLNAHQLRIKLGLSRNQLEEKLINKDPSVLQGKQLLVTFPQFCQIMNLNLKDPLARDLFELFEKDNTGVLDMKEYLLSVVLVNNSDTKRDMVSQAFKLCGGKLTRYDLTILLKLMLSLDEPEINKMFKEIDVRKKGRVTIDQFEAYALKHSEFASLYGRSLRRLSFPKDTDDTKSK